MTTVEKKLFALNIAQEGSWSRMVSQSQKWFAKKIDSKKKGKKITNTYEIIIPEQLRGKDLDIYVLTVGKGNEKIHFKVNRKRAAGTERIKVKWKKKRNHYFVIIEPSKPVCLFNKLKS